LLNVFTERAALCGGRVSRSHDPYPRFGVPS